MPGGASADPFASELPLFWLIVCVFALFVYLPSNTDCAGRTRRSRVRSQMKNAVKNTFVPQHIVSDFCIKMWIFLLFFFPFPYSPGVGQRARLCFCFHPGWFMKSAH